MMTYALILVLYVYPGSSPQPIMIRGYQSEDSCETAGRRWKYSDTNRGFVCIREPEVEKDPDFEKALEEAVRETNAAYCKKAKKANDTFQIKIFCKKSHDGND